LSIIACGVKSDDSACESARLMCAQVGGIGTYNHWLPFAATKSVVTAGEGMIATAKRTALVKRVIKTVISAPVGGIKLVHI
jgi:hypothetical protein